MRFLSNLIASTLGALIAIGVLFLFGFLFLLALAASTDRTPSVSSGSLLVVNLEGPVPEVSSRDPLAQAFEDGPRYDLRAFKQGLRKAAADTRIEGVRLNIRSTDAGWATLQEMRSALLQFKESGKPLLASNGAYGMQEKGFFLASAADSIFAQPHAPFIYNGFQTVGQFFRGTLDRLNIEPRIYRAGRYKSAVEPLTRTDFSPANEEQIRSRLRTQNTIFMQQIAESRGLSADSLRQLAIEDGLLNADDAVQAGLIDGLLYHDEVDSLFHRRLGYDADEDMPDINLRSYARVPASDAGLRTGDAGDVAVVYAVGSIVTGDPSTLMGTEVLGSERFRKAMKEARESERVKAVVVRVNSPGGYVPPSEAMRRAVAITAEQKPVLVSMGDVAASGGYWLSAPADTIVADPLTLTGSIGVFGVLFDVRGFFNDQLGVTFDSVQTSPLADLGSLISDFSDKEEQMLQQNVEDVYQAFLKKVAAGRDMSLAQVDSIGQGRVWTGHQAQELGLVDVLGGLDEAVELAAERAGLEEDSYRVRTLPRPKSFIERFAESLEARGEQAWTRLMSSPAERAFAKRIDEMRTLLQMHGTVQARWLGPTQVK